MRRQQRVCVCNRRLKIEKKKKTTNVCATLWKLFLDICFLYMYRNISTFQFARAMLKAARKYACNWFFNAIELAQIVYASSTSPHKHIWYFCVRRMRVLKIMFWIHKRIEWNKKKKLVLCSHMCPITFMLMA